MAQYRTNLPQLSSDIFLTDGGIETTLIFQEGFDLPEFAAFDLLKHQTGYQTLQRYFETYVKIARAYQVGFILESATWRANPDWAAKLGYSSTALAEANRTAIAMLHHIREQYETEQSRIVVSGCVGPRGDGYSPTATMTVEDSAQYHRAQIQTFYEAGADLVTAITMNYVEEALGIVWAAQTVGMPVVISFTVETDGHLPTGQSLKEAILQIDTVTNHAPVYYMINCAHPSHFAGILVDREPWVERIRGIRANASAKSHAELNESTTLDDGNPDELGNLYRDLRNHVPQITILGGCCGTDHRHVEAMCKATLPVVWSHVSRSTLLEVV